VTDDFDIPDMPAAATVSSPERFVMIGNSFVPTSWPVVEAGGWAVHVSAAVSWSHEDAEAPAHLHGRFVEVRRSSAFPDANQDAS